MIKCTAFCDKQTIPSQSLVLPNDLHYCHIHFITCVPYAAFHETKFKCYKCLKRMKDFMTLL
jgi:hypothetical protein